MSDGRPSGTAPICWMSDTMSATAPVLTPDGVSGRGMTKVRVGGGT